MVIIKELNISSIGEPAHVKLEKNTKGYNYEISLYGDDLGAVVADIFEAETDIKRRLLGMTPAVI
jgi:hypothetical protein